MGERRVQRTRFIKTKTEASCESLPAAPGMTVEEAELIVSQPGWQPSFEDL